MIEDNDIYEETEPDDSADIACQCGSTAILIFEDDGTVICEDCKYDRECGEDYP